MDTNPTVRAVSQVGLISCAAHFIQNNESNPMAKVKNIVLNTNCCYICKYNKRALLSQLSLVQRPTDLAMNETKHAIQSRDGGWI